MTVRIAGVIRESIVDGPGIRLVVFTQGCPHRCPGCHNPESHDLQGGYDCEVSRIMEVVRGNPLLTGVTFSGGEPFEQPEALLELAEQIKDDGLHLMIYTGYRFEELAARHDETIDRLLALTDILVDGLYLEAERDLDLKFRGSRNQRLIDLPKTLQSGEIVILV